MSAQSRPPFSSDQGPDQVHDQARNDNNGQQGYISSNTPQLDDRCLTTQTFLDFITPDTQSTVFILGAWQSLESLNHSLSPGVYAVRYFNNASRLTPLAVALSTVAAKVGLKAVTERDLEQLQRASWFHDFAQQFVKRHGVENSLDLGPECFANGTSLSEDHMALLVEAFAVSHDLSNIELGVAAMTEHGIKAFHYRWTSSCSGLTAWIVADLRTEDVAYYDLGPGDVVQQEVLGEAYDNAEEQEEDQEKEQEEGLELQTTRRTATRVLAQQVPLAAGLTPEQILNNHTANLQYNNILKVGLVFSNQDIARKLAEHATGNNNKFANGASGVVKRINTGIDFIEKEFNIDAGVFRTAYDQARKANGISIRSKDEADDQMLAANASRINHAMSWVKSGGSRPDTTPV